MIFFPSEELRLHKGCSIQECVKEEKEFPQSLGGNKEKIMSRGTPDSLGQDRNECEERKLPPPPCLEVWKSFVLKPTLKKNPGLGKILP